MSGTTNGHARAGLVPQESHDAQVALISSAVNSAVLASGRTAAVTTARPAPPRVKSEPVTQTAAAPAAHVADSEVVTDAVHAVGHAADAVSHAAFAVAHGVQALARGVHAVAHTLAGRGSSEGR